GGGSFDQLHAMDYLVYAYLQQGKDVSAGKVIAEMTAITRLDDEQFAAAYAFGAAPARLALERHDWRAAAALEIKPAWFPWQKFQNVEALVYYAKAIGAARSGDVATAREWAGRIRAIRAAMPATRDYDWSGSLDSQYEAAEALIRIAEGHIGEGVAALRAAADHEDAIDKHPVTPGALLPVREMLADILLEEGQGVAALREYQAVLRAAPRRFHATAGAARAAEKAGDRSQAAAYGMQLLEIAKDAESARPELAWARGVAGGKR